MPLSDYAKTELLDHLLGTTAFTMPTQCYLALHTADPGGTGANEATGGSYVRQAIDFDPASGGAADNGAEIEFAGMPAGTFTHLSLWDAETDGNCLMTGALSANKTVGAGDSITFAAGEVDASLT